MPKKKDWLIRTRTHDILGPISREKVIELLDGGSMDPTDELCSGNGFWFFVKEGDLLEKYIRNGEKQPFNTISEAYSGKEESDPSVNDDRRSDMSVSPPDSDDDDNEEIENRAVRNKDLREQVESYVERRKKNAPDSNESQVIVNDEGEEAYIPSEDDLEYPDGQNEEKDDLED